MLVVMKSDASAAEVEAVLAVVRELGLAPHPLPGSTRTAIGMTGNTGAVDRGRFEALPGVKEAIRVTKPYKLAGREMRPADTIISTPQTRFGGGRFGIIAGPCSVESEKLVFEVAEFLLGQGVKMLRAGAFKPRTSPYAHQGLGLEGLKILRKVREQTGIGVVTELMDTEHADAVAEAADVVQIGTRNMQNFSLLKRVGRLRRPVLLKRGMAATLDDWLMAAEYVMAGGNYDVLLCERGVRTFSDHSRNTLDLGVIPPAKQLTHLPVLVDPSHGTGKRAYVGAMALASLAAGADGLLIEIHPRPDQALSDGAQSMDFASFAAMLGQLRALAPVLGREVA